MIIYAYRWLKEEKYILIFHVLLICAFPLGVTVYHIEQYSLEISPLVDILLVLMIYT